MKAVCPICGEEFELMDLDGEQVFPPHANPKEGVSDEEWEDVQGMTCPLSLRSLEDWKRLDSDEPPF